MSDIFLSYKSEDRARAKIIAEALEREGYSVWWDRTIPPGKTFYQVIEEALDATKCVMVLWSRVSVLSDWVKNEAREGVRRRVLVPVLIDDVNIPFEFRHIQAAQLIDWQGSLPNAEFDSLLKSITEIVRRPVKTEIKKQSINDLNSSAQLLFDEGKYAEAIDKWKEVLMLDSENPKAIKGIEDAERFLKLIEINGINIFAQSLFDEGKYAKSIEKWNEVLNLDPENNVAIEGIDNARRIQRGGEERAQREREEQEGIPIAQIPTANVGEEEQKEEIWRKPEDVWKTQPKRELKVPSYFTYIFGILLLAVFALSLYLRTVMPYDNVFRNGVVAFASDDAVYHMRLVENTLVNFPHRIFYDPFTLYPYGSQLSWGPLFDQMIAFFSLVAGFVSSGGMPAQTTVDTIGAFFPAILGALVVFPVFFIGRELIDNKAGLLGAFLIAILPGQFLSRSVLGFTDHHVAEVFFTTLMMMFFIMAIKKSENITFDHWLNRDWAALKIPIIYSLLAGISFGAYLLIWTTGVFFAVVFSIFMVVQYIIDHFRGKSTEYLGVMGIIAYFAAMVMVIPYVEISNGFSAQYYSLLHLSVTGGVAIVFAFLSLVSREMNKREYKGDHYLIFVLGALFIGSIVMKIMIPSLYGATVGSWDRVFGGLSGGGLTIAEASPITPEMIMRNFAYNYYLAYIGIFVLLYYVIRKSNAEYTLIVVWSIFVLVITLAQNRFAYYYAVNVAILVGILGSKVLDFGDWKSFRSNDVIECLKKIRIQHVLSILIIIITTVILPIDNNPNYKDIPLLQKTFIYESVQSAQWGAVSSGYYEWYEALTWMRDNTPKPDLPYYSIYEKTPQGQKYNYSKNDYGVMSWWDYGHIITYWGHRIPNANPFHLGIGGGSQHAPGASTFLTAKSEEEANDVLNALGINGKPGARYIVSNAIMAYEIMPVFATWNDEDYEGYYVLVQTKEGPLVLPSMKYYENMEAKLHIFDGNGLKYYRLVHESPQNPYTQGGQKEKYKKYVYDLLYDGNIPIENSGFVKVFEYVKSAKITGRAPPGITINLTNTIKTNIGRTINYSQTTTSNGTYEFTVPYSTLPLITSSFECTSCFFKGYTRFDTIPTGPYTVTFGKVSKQIDVSEKDVLEGRSVNFDLV